MRQPYQMCVLINCARFRGVNCLLRLIRQCIFRSRTSGWVIWHHVCDILRNSRAIAIAAANATRIVRDTTVCILYGTKWSVGMDALWIELLWTRSVEWLIFGLIGCMESVGKSLFDSYDFRSKCESNAYTKPYWKCHTEYMIILNVAERKFDMNVLHMRYQSPNWCLLFIIGIAETALTYICGIYINAENLHYSRVLHIPTHIHIFPTANNSTCECNTLEIIAKLSTWHVHSTDTHFIIYCILIRFALEH